MTIKPQMLVLSLEVKSQEQYQHVLLIFQEIQTMRVLQFCFAQYPQQLPQHRKDQRHETNLKWLRQ